MLEIEDMTLEPGQVVASRYRLDRIVGEGGMGVVWAATHLLTEKQCALKFLKGDRSGDPKGQMRLLHEARAICRIRHPNVAQVHDVLELANGAPFLVMDLLDGEPLSARVETRGRLSASELLTILGPLVSAVAAAHDLGLIHRDLKPENVFLERHGAIETVRVLDFGIAKRFDVGVPVPSASSLFTSRRSLTNTNTIIGTPAYMAPEQLRLGTETGPPVDVFALGVLAYECAQGELPPRDERTYCMVHDEVARRLAARDPQLPADLADLIAHSMRDEPSARPTLEAFARAVADLARSSSSPDLQAAPAQPSAPLAAEKPKIARTSIMTPTPAPSPGPAAVPSQTFLASTSSVSEPAARRGVAAIAVLAISIALAAVGLLLILRSRVPEKPSVETGVASVSVSSTTAPRTASTAAPLPESSTPSTPSTSAAAAGAPDPPATLAVGSHTPNPTNALSPLRPRSAVRPASSPSTTPASSNHETVPAYTRE